jgi:hypothetical protein
MITGDTESNSNKKCQKTSKNLDEWIDFAEADLETAMLLLKKGKKSKKNRIFYRYSIYHLQQSSEKIGKVFVWQIAYLLNLARSYLGADIDQKYRETSNLIKRLATSSGKYLGHTPYKASNDMIKLLKLYKEGEGYLFIKEFVIKAEQEILKNCNIQPDLKKMIKDQVDKSLEDYREALKIAEIKKGESRAPNFKKVESGLEFCNKVCSCFNSIEDTINSYFNSIEDSIKKLKLRNFGTQTQTLRGSKSDMKNELGQFKDVKTRLIMLIPSLEGFINTTVIWQLLAPFNDLRYPGLKYDERIHEKFLIIQEYLSKAIQQSRKFNDWLYEIE